MKLRRSKPGPAVPDPASTPVVLTKPGGKNRPTPKRSEARARRAQNLSTPLDPKAARQHAREERRRQRVEHASALRSSDPNKLPAHERTPERVLARDLVDKRRTFGPIFLVMAVAYLILGFIPVGIAQLAALILLLVAFVGIVGDSVRLGVSVHRAVRRAYPDSRGRIWAYAAQRGMLPRRFRMPKARVTPPPGRFGRSRTAGNATRD